MSVNGQENAPQPAKTVTLPPTRPAIAWDRATDALVAAAEGAEARAKDDFEAAKERYQAARQHAHLIRQLRLIARVDAVASVRSEAKDRRWSRKFDACIVCGRTDSKHSVRGTCERCVKAARRQEVVS